MSSAAAPLPRPSARGPAHVALCVALALLAWSSAILRGGFVLDDREVLERNPVVQGSLPWREAFQRDYWQHVAPAGHFRPLATLSLRLDYRLWGESAWGFHATNVALHAACVAAAGLALLLLGARDRRGVLPWMGLAIFAVHPALADSVAWISGRTSMLAALGGLAGTLGLLFLTVPWRGAGARRTVLFVLCSAIGLLAALSAKEDGIVFGALYVVVGWKHSRKLAAAACAGCVLGVASYAALRMQALGSALPGAAFAPLAASALPLRLAVGGRAVLEGLHVLAVPFAFPPIYERSPIFAPDSPQLVALGIGGLAFLAALSIAGVVRIRAAPSSPAAWSAVFVVLACVPMLQIVPAGALFASRFLYLPLLLGVPLTHRVLDALFGRFRTPAVSALLALACALAWVRTEVYSGKLAYYGEQLARLPYDAPAYNELGLAWEETGSRERAERAFRRAIELDPGYGRAWSNLGRLAVDAGELDEALRCLQRAVELGPANPIARFNLASVLSRSARHADALGVSSTLTQRFPGFQPGWRVRARSLFELGRVEEARAALRRALELDPADPSAQELARRIEVGRSPER